MARTHGKNVNLSFNGVAIEDELNSVTMDISVGEADITAFADSYQTFVAGKKSVTISGTGSFDSAASQGDATIMDHLGFSTGPKTLIFDPTGSGPDTNDPEFTCTSSGLSGAIVTGYSISLPVGGAASYSVDFQCSGSTTRAVS